MNNKVATCLWCGFVCVSASLDTLREHEDSCPENPYTLRIKALEGMLEKALQSLNTISQEIKLLGTK